MQLRTMMLGIFCLLWVMGCSSGESPTEETEGGILFEGALLIVGDDSESIENSAFIVEKGKFSKIGNAGELDLPEGGTRIDLTGKTVMPAIVDLHYHAGHQNVMERTNGPENYSRENLIDQLNRMAYYGIGAGLSLGADTGDVPFEVRQEVIPGASLFRTAGAGIAMPMAGPGGSEALKAIAYGVTNENESRTAIQELAAQKVDMVKIWVDDRRGTVEKLTPELYSAIIDEAHNQALRVAAHIYNLSDAKDLLIKGLDGFAHGVRDMDVDDEFMELLAERPNVFLIPNLPGSGTRTEEDITFLSETLPAEEIEAMREQVANNPPSGPSESFLIQARNLVRMKNAGVRIGLGTDGSGAGWNVHEEMADMVTAGMTAGEVIIAATSTSAEILMLEDRGTIASGKIADFIVLAANPLDNIKNTRKIDSVYLRGEGVDRESVRRTDTEQ